MMSNGQLAASLERIRQVVAFVDWMESTELGEREDMAARMARMREGCREAERDLLDVLALKGEHGF